MTAPLVTPRIDLLFQTPSVLLLYRQNALYEAIRADLSRILRSLRYQPQIVALDAHIERSKIRDAVKSALQGRWRFVLADNTCHREMVEILGHRATQEKTPLGSLDAITARAAYRALLMDSTHPTEYGESDAVLEQTSRGLVKLSSLLQLHNPTLSGATILVDGLAQHQPFQSSLIRKLQSAGINSLPTAYTPDPAGILLRDEEASIATYLREVLGSTGLVVDHCNELAIPSLTGSQILVCDRHWWERNQILDATKTLPLPLSSALAHACEHGMIDADRMDHFFDHMERIVYNRHCRFVEAN
ncbi:hypothetical protein KBB08_03210 [Candidatus Gracilibacteria bacterium]|nr:hypothetical protein [Candidatus Gracilibacteria bacterium]